MAGDPKLIESAAVGSMASYPRPVGRHDAMVAADGSVRPQWRPLLAELARIDAAEVTRRNQGVRRLIRDNGVTYNVYDDAGGEARPWELDILPFILDGREWARIEAGVVQRARLANALLADIYGPRRLVADGRLPPHLTAGHPQFLRPLLGIDPPGGVHVQLYAADLTCGPDGTWTVLADRVEAPSGMGYALENRIVVSQTFAEPFRDGHVLRLASFFQSMKAGLAALARGDRPRGVLLSPGPHNEAYFEHAFLANYLGLSLVEGDDLTVHDGDVFLKTLNGLQRVDIVMRRVDSLFCDPLELKADSSLGVPGLVEAARAGRVVLTNPLGGIVVESPAMAAFLPDLCRALLDEELKLPGVPTHWCGTAAGRSAALAALDRSVVRDAFDTLPLFARGSTARLGAELDRARRQRLAADMERRGAGLVVQEVMPPCLAPTLVGTRLVPRPVALRVFAAWTPAGYVVLPGGLARVGQGDGERATLSMQSGAAGKDIWVVSDAPAERFSLLRSKVEPLPIRRIGDEAPSRAMDNLLWLGRYAERAEGLARVVRAVAGRLGDDAGPGVGGAPDLARRLLVPYAQATEAASAAADGGDGAALTREMLALVGDRAHPHGLMRTLLGVRRTAWSVRDRLSLDTWRSILALTADDDPPPGDLAALAARLDVLIRRSAALSGLSAENMTRGPNWLFLDLGRRIERGVAAAWIARQLLGAGGEGAVERMQMALEIADSAMTYRYRYLGTFQAAPVLDLLLLDEANPRSAGFQIATLARHMAELQDSPAGAGQMADTSIQPLLAKLRATDPMALVERAADGGRPGVGALADAIGAGLVGLSDGLSDRYFRPSPRRRTGSAPRGETA
ncbi:putative circularly permuted ATP-grasp superfamily protein [Stella humosa]|uniref:Putative circularly permuted ATP-grasp superfamily protein n=1 Tax=Stella humosa TaxID=94 RepID=A0A3N1KZS7_9PROT|nr:circularly permuted type 2 ATP-grasp protein [Stella humosa]ROP84160.1 putative circularly permuted ATP-grasp superfamily protein [Stella humosa]BBK33670.1 hypothetical protein STHU_43040 [Stella humosa]